MKDPAKLEAVEQVRAQQRSQKAYRSILARRKRAPSVTLEDFQAARDEGRISLLADWRMDADKL